jgi:hypothetical protein
MGPFTIQTEGMLELLVHCLHHLAYPRQPATQSLGPRRLTIALGRTNDLGSIASPPHSLLGLHIGVVNAPLCTGSTGSKWSSAITFSDKEGVPQTSRIGLAACAAGAQYTIPPTLARHANDPRRGLRDSKSTPSTLKAFIDRRL